MINQYVNIFNLISCSQWKESMDTIVRLPMNPLHRDRTITEKTETSVFNITGSAKTNLPRPDDTDNDGNRKRRKVDDDNIQVLWRNFCDNTTMHGLKNANHMQHHRLRWWDIQCTEWSTIWDTNSNITCYSIM